MQVPLKISGISKIDFRLFNSLLCNGAVVSDPGRYIPVRYTQNGVSSQSTFSKMIHDYTLIFNDSHLNKSIFLKNGYIINIKRGRLFRALPEN